MQSSERLANGLRELGVSHLRPLQRAELESVLDQKLDRSISPRHARLSPAQSELLQWLGQQCAASGPVMVTNIPVLESVDDVLIELEKVRDESVRCGLMLARKQEKSALAD